VEKRLCFQIVIWRRNGDIVLLNPVAVDPNFQCIDASLQPTDRKAAFFLNWYLQFAIH
jgi:hypothetical protein